MTPHCTLPAPGSDPTWELPPLILHPLAGAGQARQLLEGSRAALELAGLEASREGSNRAELTRRFLISRLAEIRMLFFVGRDLQRWMDQCVDMVHRTPALAGREITDWSFALLLIRHTPGPVAGKLRAWGVLQHEHLFARGLALHAVFAEAPESGQLAAGFLVDYPRYADEIFACRNLNAASPELTSAEFHFDLYASGEYARLLEQRWQEGGGTDH